MPKTKIATTDLEKEQWQYDLLPDCKKILSIWVNNKKVSWRIIKLLDIDYFGKQKGKIKIKYIPLKCHLEKKPQS